MERYPTNLTDKQWQVTEKILDPQQRKRKYPLRDIMNAILYLVKTGCQWRMLPRDFPPYNTVFYYFNKWKWEGVFEELMDTLHVVVRELMGREDTPSIGIIDSRSIKSSHHVDTDRGIDGNKKIKGRKEHIVVDTLGLPMSVVVHEANTHDSVGAEILKTELKKMKFSKAQVKYITTLVRNHIYPSQLAKENESALDKPVFRMFRKLEETTPDVLILAMADRLSAQGPDVTKEMTQNNLCSLKRYLSMYEDFLKTAKPIPKLIDGEEISQLLKIEKGKKLGEIIKELQNAQVSGDVTNKEEAIAFLKKHFE